MFYITKEIWYCIKRGWSQLCDRKGIFGSHSTTLCGCKLWI